MNCHLSLILLLLLTHTLAACDDDDCQTCTSGASTPDATIENVWPNDRGDTWTYDLLSTSFMTPITDFADSLVLEDVGEWLDRPLAASTTVEIDDILRLRIDGLRTTETGVTAQNLAGFLFTDEGGIRREIPSPFTSRDERLRARTRPVVANGLARRVSNIAGLMLDGDLAFSKSGERIGTYADVNTELAWKYVEADLSVGHRFDFPLLGGTEEGLLLRARVVAVGDFDLPSGSYEKTVTPEYMIDSLPTSVVDEGGQELGLSRGYTYGRIVYAPEVGPVYNLERTTFASTVDGMAGLGGGGQAEYWLIGFTHSEGDAELHD